MAASPDPLSLSGFEAMDAFMARAPLHEAIAAGPGEAVASLGFVLGMAASKIGAAGLTLVRSGPWSAEEGVLAPRGLAAFGIDLGCVLGVEARSAKDALWAAEQALAPPGAVVIAALRDRDVDLTLSRRLLLQAERAKSRLFLVRESATGESVSASAAYTRWRISSAPSRAPLRLLGAPVFHAELLRRRGGAAGAHFDLEWNVHDRVFRDITVARDLAAAIADRPAAPQIRRAG